MNKVVITQSNYIPWKGYFSNLRDITHYVFYDEVQYTKRDWRNRNMLIAPNGPKWLSIPIDVKGKYYQKISEAKINDKDWGTKHWNFIENNYRKAPFFEQYRDHFKPLFENKSEYLSEINLDFIKKILILLDIDVKVISSADFKLEGDKTEKLYNICKELDASEYHSAPAAKNYMNIELFESNGIKVKWYDYSNFPEYKQLWDGFEHSVSILDMFFNLGDKTKDYFNEKK